MDSISGRYQIKEELGIGGMGKVFLGLDTQTNQPVAIKQLKPELLTEDMLERFRREGQALRDLNHPNIVKMLDSLEDNGNHYLIMEYVAGGDLKDLIEQGELSIQQVLQIAIDLADALTRAHRLDIIHRDLKPANVVIADDGTPRLTDFGVAYIADKERVTGTNAIIGTIDYLAPEILSDGEVTINTKADIWAFGVLLFEMLTGTRPFGGDSLAQTIYGIVSGEVPDLEDLRPDIPVALADLVYRMLEKDPNQRVPSVRHIGASLEDILQGRSIIPPANRFETPLPELFIRAKHNLPSQVTEFVGREAELTELAKLLDAPKLRLITIIAPGGMGKTRLSLEAAEQRLENFDDGVYFVELAPLRDVASIVPAIADATGYPFDENSKDHKAELFQFLSNKKKLLVMDNYEHLMEGASLVTEILNAAPDVQILVTSRRRLEQAGETLFHLSGMDFPQWETPEDAMDYAAVKLFMQGAKRARPNFELTGDNLDIVARICRLVAGMPLGIVLAAAWLGLLSIEEVVEELQQGIDFLEAEGSAVPERQRSIRVVFEYSWQMMSEAEQAVFMQLSIFRGGFTRQAAQAITGTNLRTLMALVNKSLIRRDADSGRYEIHELLRQYARDKLENESALFEETQAKHTRYYLQLAAEKTRWLKGGKQKQASEEIDCDFENVKRAWIYAAEQQWFELLEQSYSAISIFSDNFKTTEDVAILWDTVLQNCEIGDDCPLVGLYAYLEQAQTVELILELLPFVEARQDSSLIRFTYNRLTEIHSNKQEYEQAFVYSKKNLEFALEENDPFYLGRAYSAQGYSHGTLGNEREMNNAIRISLDIFEKNNDLLGKVNPLSMMSSNTSFFEGDYQQGYNYRHELIDILLQFKRTNGLPFQLGKLAIHSLLIGKVEESKSWLEKALAVQEQIGVQETLASIEVAIAYLQCIERQHEEALKYARLSIEHSSNISVIVDAYRVMSIATAAIGDAALVDIIKKGLFTFPLKNIYHYSLSCFFLPAIVRYDLNQGQFDDAVKICSIALHHPQCPIKFFEILPLIQDSIAEFKSQLSEDEFEAAWEQGKTMEFSPVVKQFLEENKQ